MAFSLFNKNGNEPPTPAGRPRSPARGPASADGAQDHTSVKPPVRNAEGPAAKTTNVAIDRIKTEIASIDPGEQLERTIGARAASKPLVEHGFQGGARPRNAAKSAATPNVATAPARKREPDSVMMMDIQESPFEAAPALEEAAILYANRQDAAAQSALEEAVATDEMPSQAARQAWLMLFDLFENKGRRAEFEAAAIEYAVRFETSPPAFNDRSEVKSVAPAQVSTPPITLAGKLDATAAKQFEQLRVAATKHRALRIDLSRIEAIAPEGSDLLRACLSNLKKSGHEISLVGAQHAIDLLGGQIEIGRTDVPAAFWLLLLDLYQELGKHAEFEEAALNYCVTYEVSPPSWIDPPKAAAAASPEPATLPADQLADVCYLKGEIEGSAAAALKGVGEVAAESNSVVIDAYHLKRMDFIAAGSLLNLVAAMKAAGKSVEIRSPSPLLATLFVTMGFTAYAKLARRRQ